MSEPSARSPRAAGRSVLQTLPAAWPTALIAVLILVVIGSGLFATRQVLTYGSLVPSISGGWYGGYMAIQPENGQPLGGYSLYILFSTGQGDHVSATTSTCTTPANGSYILPPTAGLSYLGTMSGSRFQMSSQQGDVEPDLSWVGTYTTDQIHINFVPNGTSSRIAYATLQRGTYSDFLATCKVK